MQRILGEIVVLVMAAVVSVAVLSPGVQVVIAGVRPSPGDTAFLILGMVYGMVAPIGYFLAETWWRRALVLMLATVAAATIVAASYLFETRQPLPALAGSGVASGRLSVVVEVARGARVAVGSGSDFAQAALLAERLALASAWVAAREAGGGGDAIGRVDRAWSALEGDLRANPVIAAAPFVARLVGEMRTRLRPAARRSREGWGETTLPSSLRPPLYQAP